MAEFCQKAALAIKRNFVIALLPWSSIIVIIGSKTQTVSSYEHFPFESGQPTSGKLAPEGERLRFEVDWFLREAGWDIKLARSPPSPALMRNRGDPQNGRLRGLKYHGHPSVAAENH
jgi:hypothetical protein